MRLDKLLKNKSITQKELATKLNITQQAISGYVSGKRIPRLKIIDKMSIILEVSKDDLIRMLLNNKKTTINSPGRLKVDSGLKD